MRPPSPILRALWRAVPVVLLALLVLAPTTAAAHAAQRTAKKAPVRKASASPQRLYWGAWIGSQLTGKQAPWDFTAVDRFEQNSGKRLSLLQFSSPFFSCATGTCLPNRFPTTPFDAIRAHGAIPFFSWSSAASPVTKAMPDFRLADVAAGRYDAYITEWAASAARWGKPFFLRFNWEMNGTWFPWSESQNDNAPGSYVAAWRHVHDIFTAVGATNATWVWCPNIDPDHEYTALKGLYPGDRYVDWTCLDGYSYGAGATQSFASLFSSSYNEITTRIAPSKPMVVGETGATENGQKGKWIGDTFRALTSFPKVKAFMYFENVDTAKNINWSVETSPSSQSAFRTGIASSRFLPNQYSRITRSPIPAP
jgi:hypothetical protein